MSNRLIEETAVLEVLRRVVDPEVGCNLVDLGLIYGCQIEGGKVTVQMTLTTPGCPMHESLVHGARMALLELEGVEEADVQIVWDPPWDPSMMTEEGRALLGMR